MQDSTRESCSTSVNETINASHLYTITGYSFAKGMGLGMYLPSDPFTVGGYDWVIHFYLDGEISAQRNSTHVSIFVVFAANRPAALRHCLSYLVGPERVGEAQGYRMPPSQVYSRQTATFGACPIWQCLYLFTLEKKIIQFMFGFSNTQTNFIMNCAICTFSTHALHSGYKIRKVLVKIKKT